MQKRSFLNYVHSLGSIGVSSLLTYSSIIWLPLITALGAIAMYAYGRRFAHIPESRYLQLLLLIVISWSAVQAVDISFTDIGGRMFLISLRFLFASLMCVTLFCFIMTHCGRGRWVAPPRFALLCVIPLITLLLAETGSWHDLFLISPTIGMGGGLVRFDIGPWYYVYISYAFGLSLAAVILLIDSMRGASRIYRKKSSIMLLSFVPPAGFALLDTFRLTAETTADLSPLMFLSSAVLVAFALYRYRMVDVKPIARGEVVEHMTDAYVVVTPDGKIADYNSTAADLLVHQGLDAIGRGIDEMLPFGADLMKMITRSQMRGDVAVDGAKGRCYEASIMPVTVKDEGLAHVVLLRDITDRKNMEEALKTANTRLGLLSTITRHDLQNKLTAINGYSVLARRAQDSEKADKFLSRLDQVSASASEMIRASKDQESVGLKPPSWYPLDDLFQRAAGLINVEGVNIRSTVGTVSVFADPMIEKVFYNLLDNSLRHGKSVTSISLERRETEEGLVIEYTDDGVGVPKDNKERIFEKGFGSNTGLGMYLIREILNITGIRIVENGAHGVRFDLIVPHGRYRLAT